MNSAQALVHLPPFEPLKNSPSPVAPRALLEACNAMAFDYLPLFSSAHTYQTFFTIVGPYAFLVLVVLLLLVSSSIDLFLWYFKEVSTSREGGAGEGESLWHEESFLARGTCSCGLS